MKINRREAIMFLLGGAGCLGGCEATLGHKKPTLPENCYWLELEFAWACIPLNGSAPSHLVPKEDNYVPRPVSEIRWDYIPYFSLQKVAP